MKRSLAIISVLLGLLSSQLPSFAYEEGGHFYTIIALEHLHQSFDEGPARSEAVIYGFCAQIPDLTKELDATTLRYEVGMDPFWGLLTRCVDTRTRHMVTVQQYVHALTGSPAAAVTQAAVEIIKTLRLKSGFDPTRACAVGMALHLLGDSFAHRKIAAPEVTYPTGTGHFRDGHRPDYIGTRAELWRTYVETVIDALELKVDADRRNAFGRIAIEHAQGGDDGNRFNKAAIDEALSRGLREPPPDETLLWDPYSPHLGQLYPPGNPIVERSFEGVVETYKAKLPLGGDSLDYSKVWNIYLSAAGPAFKRHEIPVACAPEEKSNDN